MNTRMFSAIALALVFFLGGCAVPFQLNGWGRHGNISIGVPAAAPAQQLYVIQPAQPTCYGQWVRYPNGQLFCQQAAQGGSCTNGYRYINGQWRCMGSWKVEDGTTFSWELPEEQALLQRDLQPPKKAEGLPGLLPQPLTPKDL